MAARRLPCEAAAGRRLGPRRVATDLAVAMLISVLLEAGTLFGAPVASVLDPADWSKRRMAVFLLLGLALVAWFRHVDWEGLKARFRAWLEAEGGAAPRHLLVTAGICAAAIAASFLLFWVGFSALGRRFDGRLPLFFGGVASVAVLIGRNRAAVMRSPEYGVLAASLVMGVLACSLIPIYAASSWDGAIHFDRAQAVSYLRNPEYTGADSVMGHYINYDWSMLVQGDRSLTVTKDLRASEVEYSAFESAERENPVVVKGDTYTMFNGSWVSASAVGYVPLAVGLWVARLLHLPFAARYFMGRLFLTLFWSLTMFFAMRRLRSGKLVVATMAASPMLVIMAASYSYDATSIALISYSFARFAGLVQSGRRDLRASEGLGVFIPFVLGTLVKAVFFPMAIIFLLAPASRFSSRRESRLFRLGAVVSVLALMASFVLPFVSAPAAATDVRGGDDVDSVGQVWFILRNPVRYLGALLGFLPGYLAPSHFLADPIFLSAPYLFPFGTAFSLVVNSTGYLTYLATALLDRNGTDLWLARPRAKVVTLVGLFCSLALGITALYVSYTPVGSPAIGGFQTRYLATLIVPALLFGTCFRRLIPEEGSFRLRHAGALRLSVVSLLAALLATSIGYAMLPWG